MDSIFWVWGIPTGISCLAMVGVAIFDSRWARIISGAFLAFFMIYFIIVIMIVKRVL